jgi:uncharacterized damage-inducible protein DinB
MKPLLEENIATLEQAVALLPRITEEQYRQKIPACFHASIGGHIRHNLDHYLSFLSGFDHGQVDYEARERDPRIENERNHAIGLLQIVAARLAKLMNTPEDKVLHVRMENIDEQHPSAWGISTARRELLFLLSHSIHHYALVAVCCRLLGVEPGDQFGIAPSTLRHRQLTTASQVA